MTQVQTAKKSIKSPQMVYTSQIKQSNLKSTKNQTESTPRRNHYGVFKQVNN